jgi:hypothetical protein
MYTLRRPTAKSLRPASPETTFLKIVLPPCAESEYTSFCALLAMLRTALEDVALEGLLQPSEAVRLLAHELRQPLSCMEAVTFYLDLVVPPDDLRIRQQLEKLRRLIEQMNSSVDDVVHLSGATQPRPEVIDLHSVIEEVMADSPRVCPKSCELHFCDSPALVHMDPGQLRHLVGSLLAFFQCLGDAPAGTRACTYANSTEITLRIVRPVGGAVRMPPLTLASARRIVESAGGVFRFDCRAGRESVLTVRLPKAEPLSNETN